MRVAGVFGLVLAAVALFGPVAARADIIAATEVPDPTAGSHDADIALVNASSGARVPLPSGINTSQDESHPSITPDGKRLVFERVDHASNTVHIIVVDLGTGQQADLFNAFEVPQFRPITPTISPDGNTVLTGAPPQPLNGGVVVAWTQTSLANFPGGPFPHTVRTEPSISASGSVSSTSPEVTPAGVVALDSPAQGVVVDFAGASRLVTIPGPGEERDPVTSEPNGVVVFEGQTPAVFSLDFRVLGSDHLPTGSTLALSSVVNAPDATELRPTFTADGRYLVFIRSKGTGNPHLLVFDTVTQTLLNPGGVDLGPVTSAIWVRQGNVSVYTASVLTFTSITFRGVKTLVQFQLNQSSGVGILVQRIIGHHRLFGRRVATLRNVGRVPFGSFHRGRHHARWNLRVNGRRLPRGSYLITPRALASRGAVRDLGTPRRITIR